MTSKSPFDLTVRSPSDDPLDFAGALEALKTAAELLSRPEVVACMNFLRDTANAVGSVGEALRSVDLLAAESRGDGDPDYVSLNEALHTVPLQDAVKAVAVQDMSKAVAIQHAVKTVALREAARSHTFSVDDLRSIVSNDTARAIALMREMDVSLSRPERDRRTQGDRRKHH